MAHNGGDVFLKIMSAAIAIVGGLLLSNGQIIAGILALAFAIWSITWD